MSNDESTRNEVAVVLRAAIDEGIAELDAGLGEGMAVEDLMAEVRREAGLDSWRPRRWRQSVRRSVLAAEHNGPVSAEHAVRDDSFVVRLHDPHEADAGTPFGRRFVLGQRLACLVSPQRAAVVDEPCELFELDCRTPEQLRMGRAFRQYLELARSQRTE